MLNSVLNRTIRHNAFEFQEKHRNIQGRQAFTVKKASSLLTKREQTVDFLTYPDIHPF